MGKKWTLKCGCKRERLGENTIGTDVCEKHAKEIMKDWPI